MSEEKTKVVTLTQEEYAKLFDRVMWLDALEAAGVDNWGGFDEAREIYKEWMEE